jgi:N-acetylmuramoyl-L-alanine amidase
MSEIINHPSPNFDERDAAVKLQYIVLHYTGMPTRDLALQRLCDAEAKVSAHYVIDEEENVFRLVDEDKRAWHAGKSFWNGVTDMNSASIGIELVNPGHECGYRAFPAAQIDKLKDLLYDIVERYELDPAMALLGHSDIAPSRKQDPGELFPWKELAAEGFGLWPKPQASDYAPAYEDEVQGFLRMIGYECPETGVYDLATRAVLLAFQRRYEPENVTGAPTRETVARLKALVRWQSAG